MVPFVAAGVLAVIGIALVTNVGGLSDRLGDYGRHQRMELGDAAPGMTSADQLKTAGWAMLLVIVPVCIIVGIITAH